MPLNLKLVAELPPNYKDDFILNCTCRVKKYVWANDGEISFALMIDQTNVHSY